MEQQPPCGRGRSLCLYPIPYCHNNPVIFLDPSGHSIRDNWDGFGGVKGSGLNNSPPMSLEESAKINGANDFYVFLKIIMPISAPVLATIALFVGVGQWNSWFDTMLYTRTDKLETLPHLMIKMLNASAYFDQIEGKTAFASQSVSKSKGLTTNALQLAMMTITSFPIIISYPFLQKYFIKGIMIGSLKG